MWGGTESSLKKNIKTGFSQRKLRKIIFMPGVSKRVSTSVGGRMGGGRLLEGLFTFFVKTSPSLHADAWVIFTPTLWLIPMTKYITHLPNYLVRGEGGQHSTYTVYLCWGTGSAGGYRVIECEKKNMS